MKYFLSQFIWLITILKYTYQSNLSIAIVGSGIGGTSCAYFLKETFEDFAKIDIYEGDKVGGRLATITMNDGYEYETGGSVLHKRNRYMDDFVRHLGLEKRTTIFNNQQIGLHDGTQFDFVENANNMINVLKLLWQYGYSVKSLQDFVDRMLDKFDIIYKLQADGKSFDTVHDLLSAMDPEFVDYLNISVKDGYLKKGFPDALITEIVQASLRVNYGQNISVHEFVGSVSMAGMDGSLWAVKGGNKRVAEKLLEKSKARLINEYVTKITNNKNSYTLFTNTDKNATYDYVVFAAPLSQNQKIPITFTDVSVELNKVGRYHQTVSTIVIGELNRAPFSPLSDNGASFTVISTNESDFYNSISLVEGVNENGKSNVWKIFSQQPLSNNQIDRLFLSTNDVKVVDWLAYPHYEIPTKPRSFHIANRLYHINAIEWAASAMEMSCIGAKNIALLIKKHFHNSPQNETSRGSRMEL